MIEPLIELNQGEGTQTGPVTTPLGGDLSGTVAAATVATVGAKTAAAIATSVTDTVAATAANTVSTIVKRGASGEVAVGAVTAGAINGMTFRKIASGQWSVPELTATVFGPFTRTAGEVVQVFAFVANDTEDAAWSWSDGSVGDVCNIRVQRRVGATEFDVVVTKPSAGARSLDYVIVGITP